MLVLKRRRILARIVLGLCVAGALCVSARQAEASDTYSESDISAVISALADKLGVTDAQELGSALAEKITGAEQALAEYAAASQGMGSRIGRLGSRIDKVGAGAAALAALEPVALDAGERLGFAAGAASYRGESALALGAFYRPSNRLLFSLGGSTGGGESMANAGVAFALGRPEYVATGSQDTVHAFSGEVKKLEDNDADQISKLNAAEKKIAGLEGDVGALKAAAFGASRRDDGLRDEEPSADERKFMGLIQEVRGLKEASADLSAKLVLAADRLEAIKSGLGRPEVVPGSAFKFSGRQESDAAPYEGYSGKGLPQEVRELKRESAELKERIAGTESGIEDARARLEGMTYRPEPKRAFAAPRISARPSGAEARDLAGDVRRLEDENAFIKKRISSTAEEIAALQESVSETEAGAVSGIGRLSGPSVSAAPDPAKGHVYRLRDAYKELRARISDSEGRIQELERSVEQMNEIPSTVVNDDEEQLRGIASYIQKLKRENASLKEKLAEAEAKIAQLDVIRYSSTVDSIGSDVLLLKGEQESAKNRLTVAESKIYELQNNTARLTTIVGKIAQRFLDR